MQLLTVNNVMHHTVEYVWREMRSRWISFHRNFPETASNGLEVSTCAPGAMKAD